MRDQPLSVEIVRALLRQKLAPVDHTEKIFVREALGRVLATDVISHIDVPGHDNSAVDGYALRSSDLLLAQEKGLMVAGSAFAGAAHHATIPQGSVLRIMTGAVLPPQLDVVVMQEKTTILQDGRVMLSSETKPGVNIRRAGEDLKKGSVAVKAGRLLQPADLGIISSLGRGEIAVYRRLRVTFFSSGNELLPLGDPPRDGWIYDSNRYTLHGLLRAMGCEVVDMGVVRDDSMALEKALREAMTHSDVLITTGGMSVGEADFIKEALQRVGEVLFWKVAMKPGRPLAFGRLGSCWFFGLPGNPVAVMVTFHQLVRECLHILMGVHPLTPPPQFSVECVDSLKKMKGRTEYQRGELFQKGNNWAVKLAGSQGSGILHTMSAGNCYIVLAHDQGAVNAGEHVQIELFQSFN